MKVNVESDSEEEEEEKVVVVEVEQRSPSPNLQDRITGRQFIHMQVSHDRVVSCPENGSYGTSSLPYNYVNVLRVSCRWS